MNIFVSFQFNTAHEYNRNFLSIYKFSKNSEFVDMSLPKITVSNRLPS